jgi:hypothetical protein
MDRWPVITVVAGHEGYRVMSNKRNPKTAPGQPKDNGETLLIGPAVDRAALHGLLRKARDLGMPLVSVIQVDPKQANGPDVNADADHNRSKKETNT